MLIDNSANSGARTNEAHRLLTGLAAEQGTQAVPRQPSAVATWLCRGLGLARNFQESG
jgi:hypothetical protein